MSTKIQKIILAAVMACCLSMVAKADGTGTNNGYFWSLWHSGGSANITFGSGGNFNLTWSGVNDVVGGKGWNPGSARTINYNCGYMSSSFHSFGVYGWTTNPLIEYYIDDMGNAGGTFIGTVSSDGGTYNVYKQQRVNSPSIQGTATFWQYKNSRQTWQSKGANHSITTSNHFNYWKSHIGSMGAFNVQFLACEAFSGSGSCNATVW